MSFGYYMMLEVKFNTNPSHAFIIGRQMKAVNEVVKKGWQIKRMAKDRKLLLCITSFNCYSLPRHTDFVFIRCLLATGVETFGLYESPVKAYSGISPVTFIFCSMSHCEIWKYDGKFQNSYVSLMIQ